jgi:hypothetical protein
MIKLKLNQRIKLSWLDSNFQPGWHYGDVKSGCPIIESVGWIAAIEKSYVVIVSTQGGPLKGKLNPLIIPKGAIQSVEKV